MCSTSLAAATAEIAAAQPKVNRKKLGTRFTHGSISVEVQRNSNIIDGACGNRAAAAAEIRQQQWKWRCHSKSALQMQISRDEHILCSAVGKLLVTRNKKTQLCCMRRKKQINESHAAANQKQRQQNNNSECKSQFIP